MFCAKHILFLVRSRLFICFKVFLGNGRMPSRSIKTNAKVFISRKAVHLSFVTAVFFTQHHCSYHITRLSFFAQLCVFSMVCFYHHIQKQHRQLDPLTTESRSYSHRDTFLNSNNSSLTLCIGFSFVFIRWQAMSLQACFFSPKGTGVGLVTNQILRAIPDWGAANGTMPFRWIRHVWKSFYACWI